MNWLKILVGFFIAGGILVAWYRVMKSLRGDNGGPALPVKSRPKRGEPQPPNELEQFIARHRASEPARADRPTGPPRLTVVASNPGGKAPGLPPSAALLSGAGKVAFLAFKAALPECHVLARVDLAQVVPADPSEPQAGPHTLAVVICRSDFTVIAAADVSGGAAAAQLAMVGRLLESRSIRHLILDPSEMPKPKEIRALLQA